MFVGAGDISVLIIEGAGRLLRPNGDLITPIDGSGVPAREIQQKRERPWVLEGKELEEAARGLSGLLGRSVSAQEAADIAAPVIAEAVRFVNNDSLTIWIPQIHLRIIAVERKLYWEFTGWRQTTSVGHMQRFRVTFVSYNDTENGFKFYLAGERIEFDWRDEGLPPSDLLPPEYRQRGDIVPPPAGYVSTTTSADAREAVEEWGRLLEEHFRGWGDWW